MLWPNRSTNSCFARWYCWGKHCTFDGLGDVTHCSAHCWSCVCHYSSFLSNVTARQEGRFSHCLSSVNRGFTSGGPVRLYRVLRAFLYCRFFDWQLHRILEAVPFRCSRIGSKRTSTKMSIDIDVGGYWCRVSRSGGRSSFQRRFRAAQLCWFIFGFGHDVVSLVYYLASLLSQEDTQKSENLLLLFENLNLP